MLDKKLTDYTFTVVDTETTGLSPYKGARLVEIGAVKIYPGLSIRFDKGFSTLINPEKPIPPAAYKIHKISDEVVADAPKIHEVLPHFSKFVENTVFVAHNASFDFKFIDYFYKTYNMSCPLIAVVDTLKIARKVIKGLKSYSLDSLIDYFQIKMSFPGSYRHRAIFDAAHTAVIFKKLLDYLLKENSTISLYELIYYFH
ncbi:3'-5' exonuclease [Deferribacter autotrophicus]|uniref:3'-5' exonuclease n=1 Tax=Deferribacter autotrophicus TaxID=500465 RepID=A0A5A8F7J3_9BACT|nr:3'-5' exonuclease [Deferribacter autotrophicus]KAA0259018.1 3'-5' exonuclease [Deferribacter autotrophicus]